MHRDGAQQHHAMPHRGARGKVMEPKDLNIDELARRLAASLPGGLKALQADAEQNFRAVLQSGLSQLDLVTREEFDVQAAVLKRTREKLEALEARLTALETPPER
jgi:ubiquinone biosynthesis accessory factor UbiK